MTGGILPPARPPTPPQTLPFSLAAQPPDVILTARESSSATPNGVPMPSLLSRPQSIVLRLERLEERTVLSLVAGLGVMPIQPTETPDDTGSDDPTLDPTAIVDTTDDGSTDGSIIDGSIDDGSSDGGDWSWLD